MNTIKKLATLFTVLAMIMMLPSCTEDCTNSCINGTLNQDNCECSCDSGFSGADCSVEDLCITQNPNCQNGGTCEMGVCNCPDGYEGADCSVESRDKFIGSYSGNDVCSVSGSSGAYTSIISDSPTGITSVLITDIWDKFFINAVIGTVDGTQINIADQAPDNDSYRIEGSGVLNEAGTIINWTYLVTETSSGNMDNCTMEATKQ